MKLMTYSQIRKRLAAIMKNVFTQEFESIYKATNGQYSEEQLIERNKKLSDEIRDFTHKVYEDRNDILKLNQLYSSVDPEIICCFYYRYWVIINLLQMSQKTSPNQKFAVEYDDEALLYQLFFDVTAL